MSPDLIFKLGVTISGIVVVIAIIIAIMLRVYKVKLNKKFDVEYGKRRH